MLRFQFLARFDCRLKFCLRRADLSEWGKGDGMGMGWGREEIYLFGVLNIRLRGFEGFSECLPFYCFDVDFRRRTELMYSMNVLVPSARGK